MIFRARQFEFTFPRPALVMGIVNVTPDSFSDGGNFLDTSAAVAHAMELVRQGAEILDIGGESTRPGATPVGEAEELRRVIPVIELLAAAINSSTGRDALLRVQADRQVGPTKLPVLISIDTTKPAVAHAALAAGASIVNDIAVNSRSRACESADSIQNPNRAFTSAATSAATTDEMWRVVAESGAGYVCMHMQGAPATMQIEPRYADVVNEVGEFFVERLRRLQACGVSAEQVVLDAGIGFGKTPEHNLQLLAGLRQFTNSGRPLLLGVSRKSFIGKLLGAEAANRLPASLAATVLALADGVQMFRTHDVAATVQAVRMAEGVLALKKK